jgi:hypothetical protein
MKLILIAMLIVAVMPAALADGDYLHPDMSQKYLSDWLEGGYVRSLDRSMLMDPGIAGMVRWLDTPVPSYPWYSSDVSFYKQMVPASTFTPFREYYAAAEVPQEAEIISSPVRFNITLGAPLNVFYGSGQGLPFSQYLSIEPSRNNDLWIRGPQNWTQYVVSPMGAAVELVANVPRGGSGGFYQTVQTETSSLRSGTYQFHDGYNIMSFRADRIGRHLLYLVVNNQPSNVVVIDVFAQAPAAQPSPSTQPSQSAQPFQAANTLQYPSGPQVPASTSALGDTPLTIFYPGPGNFQVYVDGVEVGVGSGSFTTRVKGGTTHMISVWDGFWMYQNNVYFESGQPKVINVESV